MRRRGRTILTLLGLAVGVGLVIAISSLSKGLDEAQSATLDPLAGIGTDLTVTRAAQEDAGGGPFGGGGGRDVVEANQAVITDLSKLGKAGHALRPRLLPAGDAADLHRGAGEGDREARRRRRGLVGSHPPGRAPGGEGAEDRREDRDRRRPDRRQPGDRAADGGGAGGDPGLPREARRRRPGRAGRRQRRRPRRRRPRRRQTERAPAAATATRSRSACPSGCSGSARRSRRRGRRCSRCSTRRRPTSRASRTRSAASQLGDPAMGLVTAAQVTKGRFLRGGREALVSATYAARNSLKVGSKLNLNGTTFTVVGLVNPPLGGQGVDVYLPLAQLQKLSGQKDLVNLVLVRADDSASVAAVETADRGHLRAGRGREREAGRRHDQRLARRRREPLAQPRPRALDRRRRRRVPPRRAARALVGRASACASSAR